ncbi:MAG: toll/interleukin-1 receptor domain-containing protein, partial [Chitinophagaceae bacterium]
SDGKCMAKFEIGFNDIMEQTLRAAKPAPELARELLISHLRKYITVPVKIKIGNRLSKFIPLVDAGNKLRAAYYWATTTGPKSFNPKDLGQKVENFDPRMVVHVDSGVFDLSAFSADKVDFPELENQGIDVYSLMVPYFIEKRRYHIKTWLIATVKSISTTAIQPADFQYFSSNIRHLRINLLRINIESILQKRLTSKISDPERRLEITDPKLSDQVFQYIHKIFLNLSKIKRNTQPQQQLIEAAIRLEEKYGGGESLDERIAGVRACLVWMKNLPVSENNLQVINAMEKELSDLTEKKISRAAKPSVFISYNHHDQPTAFLLRDALEKEGFDVILDSDDMLAGTPIKQFITDSVKNSDTTLLIASRNSLKSGWVGTEIVNTQYFHLFFPQKKFRACYVDESFTEKDFVDLTIAEINLELARLNESSNSRFLEDAGDQDLIGPKGRFNALKDSLPALVALLNDHLSIDVRPPNFEFGVKKLVSSL